MIIVDLRRFNALLRASFFSTQELETIIKTTFSCFNALLRATFFSTNGLWLQEEKERIVSMPYFGLFPFLRYVSTAIDFTGFPASIL